MPTYQNITITFTINPDDVTLKVQATCDSMCKSEIIMALELLKSKIESDEFDTLNVQPGEDCGYYSEETFPLDQPKPEINKEHIIASMTQRIKDEQRKHEESIGDWHEIAARKIYGSFDIKPVSEIVKPKDTKSADEAWEKYRASIYEASKKICGCTEDKKLPSHFVDGFCGHCGNQIE
jgi:hypothetical protein